jgi:hypothetical protein
MPKATFAYLRLLNAAILPWVMFALLLPVLLGLLPAATRSAEAAFEHKLAQSICAPLETGDEGGPQDPTHHAKDCILCAIGCTVCGSAPAATAALASRMDVAAAGFPPFAEINTAPLTRTRAHTPRAPPILS